MSDESQKPMPTGKSVLDGTLAQAFGSALGVLYVLHQASNGHYFPAGYELALGTVFSTVCYVLYKLFGTRIIRWSRRQ